MQQLQKWRGEYNQIIAKYRLKEVEVRELQSTLKQVRAEQLEQRRRELEEKRQRLRDHKEQEALEKQIRQLEVRLTHERGGRVGCV